MKKLFTLLALTISFSINAQVSTNSTNPSGANASAIGSGTTASGEASTAMGAFSTASGNYSTSMGRYTTASDYGSLVIGQYNSSGSSVTNSSEEFSEENTAFVIGNGTNSSNKSDAFKVMFNGDAYISSSLYLAGTAITATAAEINLLDGLTTVGSGILSSVTENGNTGVRLSTSNASNHGDIGSNAVDLSYSNSSSSTRGATGNISIAMGDSSTASGIGSTAMGNYTIASGIGSTAMGAVTIASGANSTAIGYGTTASETFTTAMGYDTTASGPYSTAMGGETTASGNYSTAIGAYSAASGICSTAMGAVTIASGDASTAIGSGTTASDYASLVIGRFNSSGSSVTNSATSFNTANTAFVIGNGTGPGPEASDALTVLFDGTTTIAGDLSINSDARLKANIISLGSTLAKVLQIDGKSYTMKKDENKKQKIGVLAQDIEKVFPELVSESNGVKSVNYQGLVPVLINALKEQQTEIEILKEQQAEIDELKEMVQALVSRE